MPTQIVDKLGPSPPAQILGTAHDDEREGGEPDRNHVRGDELPTDAGIKPSGARSTRSALAAISTSTSG